MPVNGDIIETRFHKDSANILWQTIYIDDDRELFRQWHENGSIEVECFHNKKGLLDGKYLKWNKKGYKVLECELDDAMVTGPYKEYWSNGKIKKECSYIKSKYDGPYREYDRHGNVVCLKNYKDGKKQPLKYIIIVQ